MKTMPEKLDKEKIQELLRKADEKWFASHGGYKYQEHLEFTAEYLAKHYKVGGKKSETAGRMHPVLAVKAGPRTLFDGCLDPDHGRGHH